MVFRKRTALILAIVLLTAAAGSAIMREYGSVSVSASVNERPTVILDAGHGGFDGGAVAPDGTIEKDINLKIAVTLRDFLRVGGFEVIMTRESDVSTDDAEGEKIASRKKSDMRNRLELINKYPDAVFVSIHLNKFTTSAASGSQIFYGPKREESKLLSDYIQSAVVKLLQPQNQRVSKQATKSTYLLYNAEIPAVIVECGFLSNPAELERLKDEEYQKKMAFSIFCGIQDYYSA